MNQSAREPYLQALDLALAPHRFSRKKRSFEWTRVDNGGVSWVHLNFGLAVVNPSVGVRYLDLEALIPAGMMFKPGTMQSLSGEPVQASTQQPTPIAVARVVVEEGLPWITCLHDRTELIRCLQNDQGPWPVFGWSSRARLLPALLLSQGRLDDALHEITRFEAEAPVRDQMLPSYAAFASEFRSKHGA